MLPGADRALCASLVTIGQGELDFGSQLVTRLNSTVQGAVHDANFQGIPVFFAPQVEDAFLPDHTVCDQVPYARGIDKLREADPSLAEQLEAAVANVIPGGIGKAAELWVKFQSEARRLQELFHPNLDGYQAWTRALIRWSNTDDGKAAFHPVAHQPPGPKIIVGNASPSQTITVDSSNTNIAPGGTYTVVGDGFLQGSQVSVNLQSSPIALADSYADNHGAATVGFAVPRYAPTGTHELVILGVDNGGAAHTVRITVHVAPLSGIPWLAVLCAIGLLSAAAGTFFLLRGFHRSAGRDLAIPGTA